MTELLESVMRGAGHRLGLRAARPRLRDHLQVDRGDQLRPAGVHAGRRGAGQLPRPAVGFLIYRLAVPRSGSRSGHRRARPGASSATPSGRWSAGRCSSSRSSRSASTSRSASSPTSSSAWTCARRRPVGAAAPSSVLGIRVQERHIAMIATTAHRGRGAVRLLPLQPLRAGDAGDGLRPGGRAGAGRQRRPVFALSWAMAAGLAADRRRLARHRRGVDQQLWMIALEGAAGDHPRRARLPRRRGRRRARGRRRGVAGRHLPGRARSPGWATTSRRVSPYVLMLLVLLVRPYGLFGTREVKRV